MESMIPTRSVCVVGGGGKSYQSKFVSDCVLNCLMCLNKSLNLKKKPEAIIGQVTRSGQVSLPLKLFRILKFLRLKFLRYQYETFRS